MQLSEFAKNAALVVASVTLCALGIELGTRALGPDMLTLGNHYAFYRFDEVVGWTNTPGESGTYTRGEFSYPVKNNAEGLRDREISPRPPGQKRIAVLGDSFTWGVGAADGERFTEVVEQLEPRYDVLNFGVSGYGTVQEFLLLDRVLSFDPDFVVVALCLGNDPIDNVSPFRYNYDKPTAELRPDGDIAIKGYPLYHSESFGTQLWGATSYSRVIGFIEQIFRRRDEKAWMRRQGLSDSRIDETQLYLPDAALAPDIRAEKDKVFAVTTKLLERMRDKVAQKLGPHRFEVLFVPTKFEVGTSKFMPPGGNPNEVADALQARLARAGVAVVDGRRVIRADDFWHDDGHWNPHGHRVIGELLTESLRADLGS